MSMRLPYTHVMMKHVAIPANSSTICLDNIFTGALPDLVVMGIVTNTAIAGSYTENPFNFKKIKIKRINLFRNGVWVPTSGYSPNFSKNLYNEAYFTFQEQHGFE